MWEVRSQSVVARLEGHTGTVVSGGQHCAVVIVSEDSFKTRRLLPLLKSAMHTLTSTMHRHVDRTGHCLLCFVVLLIFNW